MINPEDFDTTDTFDFVGTFEQFIDSLRPIVKEEGGSIIEQTNGTFVILNSEGKQIALFGQAE